MRAIITRSEIVPGMQLDIEVMAFLCSYDWVIAAFYLDPAAHGSHAGIMPLPTILGTGVAIGRLSSGQRVTVDGDAGTVMVSSLI
jgi:hypothetical protein